MREGGLQVAELVTLPANVQAARSEDERPGRVPVAVDLADDEGLLMPGLGSAPCAPALACAVVMATELSAAMTSALAARMRNLSMSTCGIVVPPGGSPDGAWHHSRTLEVSETGQLPRAG